ncbi:hypothetical protein H0H87_011326 [Tephrocybe sp. NHM501043]|nr:hypothetical protein H0H87_011326 [Tephrocybe sp. NHM501043]
MLPKKSKAKAMLSKVKGLVTNTLLPLQSHLPLPIPANQSTSGPVQVPIAIGQLSVQSAPGASAGHTSVSPASVTFNDPNNAPTLQPFHPLSTMTTGPLVPPAATQTPLQLVSSMSAGSVNPSPGVNAGDTTGNIVLLQVPAVLRNNLSTWVPTMASAVVYSHTALTPATVNTPAPSVAGANASSGPMPSSVSVSAANQDPAGTSTVTHINPSPATSALSATKENDSWEVAKNVLDTTLNLLLQSSDGFGPLKSAIGGLVGVINLFKSTAANREDYSQLESELGDMVATLKQYGQLNPKEPGGSVA